MPRYTVKYPHCSKCYIFSFSLRQRLSTNTCLRLLRPRVYLGSDADGHGGHRAGSGLPRHAVGHREGAAGHAHGGVGQLVVLRPLVELRAEALDALLVLLLGLVPAADQVGAAVQRRGARRAHAHQQRRREAPLAGSRAVALHREHVHALPAGPHLAAPHHIHPAAQRERAVPAAGRAQRRQLLPRVAGRLVRAHRARVRGAHVPAGHQHAAIGDRAGVAAAGHLQGRLRLPLIGGRHVALQRGQAAFRIAAAHRVEEPVEHAQAEVRALLVHAGQVYPGVEAGIVPGNDRGSVTAGWLQPGSLWYANSHNVCILILDGHGGCGPSTAPHLVAGVFLNG